MTAEMQRERTTSGDHRWHKQQADLSTTTCKGSQASSTNWFHVTHTCRGRVERVGRSTLVRKRATRFGFGGVGKQQSGDLHQVVRKGSLIR